MKSFANVVHILAAFQGELRLRNMPPPRKLKCGIGPAPCLDISCCPLYSGLYLSECRNAANSKAYRALTTQKNDLSYNRFSICIMFTIYIYIYIDIYLYLFILYTYLYIDIHACTCTYIDMYQCLPARCVGARKESSFQQNDE